MGQKLLKIWRMIRSGRGNVVLMLFFRHIPIWLLRYQRFYIGFTAKPGEGIDLSAMSPIFKRLEFARATPNDVDDLVELCPQKTREKYLKRFERGNICMIAKSHGKCVGMVWADTQQQHREIELNCRFMIPGECAWIYDAFIAQRFRSRGVYLALSIYFIQHTNFRGFYGFMSAENQATLKSHSRLGAELIREVYFFSLFGLTCHIVKDLQSPDHTSRQIIWSSLLRRMPSIDLTGDQLEEEVAGQVVSNTV